jgi:hypothetical protein
MKMFAKYLATMLPFALALGACHNKKTGATFPEVATEKAMPPAATQEQAGSFDQMPEQEHKLVEGPVTEDTIPSQKPAEEDENAAVEPQVGQVEPDHVATKAPCLSKECQKRREGLAAYREGLNLFKKGQWEEALNLYLKACQYGIYRGCHRYGWHMQQIGNERNAQQFFNQSCKQGKIERSCNNLGFLAEQRGDLHTAKDYYAYACIEGSKGGCANLKRVYSILFPKR